MRLHFTIEKLLNSEKVDDKRSPLLEFSSETAHSKPSRNAEETTERTAPGKIHFH